MVILICLFMLLWMMLDGVEGDGARMVRWLLIYVFGGLLIASICMLF